jgi:thiamine transporter ThiT
LKWETDAQLVPYHAIYRSLYYIPIAVAAVHWGLRGGMVTAVVICVLYIPHTLIALHATVAGIDALLEWGAFLFVVGLTGYLPMPSTSSGSARSRPPSSSRLRRKRLSGCGPPGDARRMP